MDTALVCSELDEAQRLLSAALASLAPAEVPLLSVVDVWERFAKIQRGGEAGQVLLQRRVAESNVWPTSGSSSAAEWIAGQTGTPVGRARDDIETSAKLDDCPGTAEALRRGDLSADQAAAVADAAVVNPGAEQDLLELAKQESLKRLKDEAARRKAQAQNEEERQKRIHRERRARAWTDRHGVRHLHASGPVADLAALEALLGRRTTKRFEQARTAGDHESHDAYAFDALTGLADLTAAGEPKQPNPKHTALIHVDLEALVRGRVEGDEVCEIPGLGTISVEQARRLLGDSILYLVLTRADRVANVTHLGRGPRAAQTIALLWSSYLCAAEGCNRRTRQADHRDPFAKVHETHTENLDGLCGPMHDDKTLRGWALVAGTGRRPFVPPDDPRHPNNTDAPPPTAVTEPKVPPKRGAPVSPELLARLRAAIKAAAPQPKLFDTG